MTDNQISPEKPSPEQAEKSPPAVDSTIDLRLDLVSDLEEKIVKDGLSSGSTQERLSLVKEVLSNDDLEEATAVLETVRGSLDQINEKSIEALQSLTEASGYAAAYLLAKNKPESPSIHSIGELVQLSGFCDSEVQRKLAETWKILADNPKSALSRLYQSDYLPETIRESNALAAAALDSLSYIKEAPGKATGWVKKQFEERPIVAGSLLTLGALGLGTMIYKSMRRKKIPASVESAPTAAVVTKAESPGIVSRIGSALKYLPHALLASGGMMIGGMILGTDQVQSYLEKKLDGNLSFIPETLYQRRLPATFIHLCSGRPLDALGTFAFGGRDSKAKMRHEIYAKYFGVEDKEVWAVSGVTLKELLDADPSREYPLAAGFLKHIPYLNTKLAESGLTDVENKIRDRFIEKMDLLVAKDPTIKTKSVDEALRIAFAEGIFNSIGDEVSASDGPEGTAVLATVQDYDTQLDAIAESEKLTETQIEALKVESETLHTELDELRIAMPGQFAELKKSFMAAFPVGIVEQSEKVVDYNQDVDLIATQEFYEQFASQVLEEDMSSMKKDLASLELAQSYFGTLVVGQTPDEMLKGHVSKVKEINRKLRTWKFRAEQSRHEAIQADDAEWNLQEDGAEIGIFYWIGYTSGIPRALQWSVKTVTNPKTGVKEKVVAVAAGVGATILGVNAAIGLYQFTHGSMRHGLIRVLIPGPHIAYETFTLHRNFGHIIGYNTPSLLLEKVARGEMTAAKALAISERALKHNKLSSSDVWLNRMKGFQDLNDIIGDNSNAITLLSEDPTLAKVIDDTTDLNEPLVWKKQLKNLVKENFGETLEEFFTRMKGEKAARLTERLTPVRLAAMIDSLTDRLNLPKIPHARLVQLLAEGGPIRSFFMASLNQGVRIGLPAGASLLSAYFACNVVYTGDHDKAEKFAMLGTGLIAAELTYKGGVLAKGALHGTTLASRVSKHPIALGIGAIVGLIGVSYVAEQAIAPYLKTKNVAAASALSVLSDVTYAGTGGHIIDLGMHYLTDQEEKEYFMRTTNIPFVGTQHLAFVDGSMGYGELMDADSAVTVYNYRINESIKKLEEQKPETDKEASEIKEQIAVLSGRIINKNWIIKKTIEFDLAKVNIQGLGQKLQDQILKQYSGKLKPNEVIFVKSLLTMDVPHSWIDEEFMDIEKETRVALIRRLTNEMGLEDEFESFIAAKRTIQSDVQFYQLIEKDDEIVNVSDVDKNTRLMSVLDVSSADIEVASSVYAEEAIAA